MPWSVVLLMFLFLGRAGVLEEETMETGSRKARSTKIMMHREYEKTHLRFFFLFLFSGLFSQKFFLLFRACATVPTREVFAFLLASENSSCPLTFALGTPSQR
ncbi:Uncharacterized protein TCM_041872 [Theobroma cacao]|uniref:Secreted protein n=1 Tax=Theobroma cacao TaxID=3641 RepID=A0A061GXD9_THECC|nr:Uncharacterized protein TCM_041872 [Theobroma cacao]